MKIYTRLRIKISTWEVLEEESFGYDGPLALCFDSDGEDGNDGSSSPGGGYDGGNENDGSSRGGVGDDPSVAGGGWNGFDSYSDDSSEIANLLSNRMKTIEMEDQADSFLQILNFVVSLAMPAAGLPAMLFSLGVKLGLSDWAKSLPEPTVEWGDPVDNGDAGYNELIRAVTSSNYQTGGGKREQNYYINQLITANTQYQFQAQQPTFQAQQPQAQQIQANKWVAPPIQEPDGLSAIFTPYSIINFPPPIAMDIYKQPKTSIWYT